MLNSNYSIINEKIKPLKLEHKKESNNPNNNISKTLKLAPIVKTRSESKTKPITNNKNLEPIKKNK